MNMSSMVKGVGPDVIGVNIPFKIAREVKEDNIITKNESTLLSFFVIVYNKRVMIDNFDTLPYGF